MNFKNIFRNKIKIDFKNLLKYQELKRLAKRLKFHYKEDKQLEYCATRVGAQEVIEYASDWKTIKDRHEYIRDITLYEFLNNNPSFTRGERMAASEASKLVGQFYSKCVSACEVKAPKVNTIKPKRKFISTPRTD